MKTISNWIHDLLNDLALSQEPTSRKKPRYEGLPRGLLLPTQWLDHDRTTPWPKVYPYAYQVYHIRGGGTMFLGGGGGGNGSSSSGSKITNSIEKEIQIIQYEACKCNLCVWGETNQAIKELGWYFLYGEEDDGIPEIVHLRRHKEKKK